MCSRVKGKDFSKTKILKPHTRFIYGIAKKCRMAFIAWYLCTLISSCLYCLTLCVSLYPDSDKNIDILLYFSCEKKLQIQKNNYFIQFNKGNNLSSFRQFMLKSIINKSINLMHLQYQFTAQSKSTGQFTIQLRHSGHFTLYFM